MRKLWWLLLLAPVLWYACMLVKAENQQEQIVHASGKMPGTIAIKQTPYISTIITPKGFQRIPLVGHSFGSWLRQLPLRSNNTVYLYNGKPRPYQWLHHTVLDIPIGKEDLLQCADAIMYCRAAYLYNSKSKQAISFTDNKGKVYSCPPTATQQQFQQFLRKVYSYCNSASLVRQMKPVRYAQLQPGDVLLRGGFPGHGVLVVDMCQNAKGERLYLLAQGFMPAQDIHIVKNPEDKNISPWYRLDTTATTVQTPQYLFYTAEAMRF